MPASTGTHRLGLTLAAAEYERIVAYARAAGRPVATMAKRVLLGVIDGHNPDAAAAALSRERDRVRELESEVMRLQAQLAQHQAAADLSARLPRWRWPLEVLLADHEWWDEWLPRLGELVGRNLQYGHAYDDGQSASVVDDRGFADLMGYLFPNVEHAHGAPVRWSSPEYARYARLAWQTTGTASRWQRPVRAEVWEPVVRHVALALAALETTSQDPGDAYTHLRVEAEIRGEWMRTLEVLVGDGISSRPVQLPRKPLP
ncbi:MAG: hypothetical protein E6J41_17500 [Chloroflexi bacterium]|nr:MAG: hypothetical protein E6J41_17500 [Chloroflexota bacterium]